LDENRTKCAKHLERGDKVKRYSLWESAIKVGESVTTEELSIIYKGVEYNRAGLYKGLSTILKSF
jgi:hypothetical protein